MWKQYYPFLSAEGLAAVKRTNVKGHVTKDMVALHNFDNFEMGTFTCASEGVDHALPSDGIYIATELSDA